MFDFWFFMEFVIAVLFFGGILAVIGKFFVSKKDERRDPLMWKKFGLGLAIALIFPGIITYGFATFVDEPVAVYTYDQLMPTEKWNREIGKTDYFSPPGESITHEQYQVLYEKYQDKRYEEQSEFRSEMDTYRMYLFITMVGFGVAAVVAGMFIAIPAANTGTLYGGVFSMMFGYISYWSYMNEVAIFVSFLLAFIALFYVAYRKFKVEGPGIVHYGKEKPKPKAKKK